MYFLETRKQSQHQWRNFKFRASAESKKRAPDLHLALYGLKMGPFRAPSCLGPPAAAGLADP